jgi:hypothetical protein
LSPAEVYENLLKLVEDSGKNDLALLCYEKPGETCHRRAVAEWLQQAISISMPEYTIGDKQLSLI